MEPNDPNKCDNKEPSDQCQFFLTKKKRLCRFRPKPGQKYCPEHGCIMGVDDGRKRIPCPLNANHNCYEDELQKHLKVCNVTKIRQKTQREVYFREGINRGIQDESLQETNKVSINELKSEDLVKIIDRVNRLYKEKVEPIQTALYEHQCVRDELGAEANEILNDVTGKQAMLRKELLQQASLIGQLDQMQCLQGKHCFVELGAGKGKLSHWIQKACRQDEENTFLLVERGSVRYKMDGFHKKDDGKNNFKRIKIDIEDLNLGPIPEVQSHPSVVVVGKHLCGGATDMGLRCAVQTLEQDKRGDRCASSPESTKTAVKTSPTSTATSADVIDVYIDEEGRSRTSSSSPSQIHSSDKGKLAPHERDKSQIETLQNQTVNYENSDGEPVEKLAKHCTDPVGTSHRRFKRSPTAIMIALCCHHRCTWETYVGKKFMVDSGISPEEFDLLTRLSSWATCAKLTVKTKRIAAEKKMKTNGDVGDQSFDDEAERDKEHCVEDLLANSQSMSFRESLSVAEREEVGVKCKRIIDMGRLQYLREEGMHCHLRKYIDESLTPENIVLVATATS